MKNVCHTFSYSFVLFLEVYGVANKLISLSFLVSKFLIARIEVAVHFSAGHALEHLCFGTAELFKHSNLIRVTNGGVETKQGYACNGVPWILTNYFELSWSV